MANHVAVRLDRSGEAEMSCIAGVGGDVPSLVRVAKSGRPIVVVDGCPLRCAQSCLARHGVAPDVHVTLTDGGARKRFHEDFDLDEADAAHAKLLPQVQALTRARRTERSAG